MSDPTMPPGHHAHVSAAGPAVRQLADALDGFCAAEGLPGEVAWQLQVVLDEIVANVVGHGGAGGPTPVLDVWFRRDGDVVEITVADDGPAFDPLSRPDPDVTLPLEARQPGGLGIMLVKSLMDEVRYERTTRNILTIRKRITAGDAPGGAEPDEHPAKRT